MRPEAVRPSGMAMSMKAPYASIHETLPCTPAPLHKPEARFMTMVSMHVKHSHERCNERKLYIT